MKKYFTMLLITLAALFVVPTTTAEAAKKPINVSFTEDEDNVVHISWTDKNKAKGKKYVVYRSDDEGLTWHKLGKTMVTEYYDCSITESGLYLYRVKTVLKNGKTSKMSKQIVTYINTEEDDIDDDEAINTEKVKHFINYLPDNEGIPESIYEANYELVDFYRNWVIDPIFIGMNETDKFIYDMHSYDDIIHNINWMLGHGNYNTLFYIPNGIITNPIDARTYFNKWAQSVAHENNIFLHVIGNFQVSVFYVPDRDFCTFETSSDHSAKNSFELLMSVPGDITKLSSMQREFHEKYIVPMLMDEVVETSFGLTEKEAAANEETIKRMADMTEEEIFEATQDGEMFSMYEDHVIEHAEITIHYLNESEIRRIYEENFFKEYPILSSTARYYEDILVNAFIRNRNFISENEFPEGYKKYTNYLFNLLMTMETVEDIDCCENLTFASDIKKFEQYKAIKESFNN